MNVTQNCVSFTNPCTNLLARPSVTRKYHPKELEVLHLLQCIVAHLPHTLLWVCRETYYLGLFSTDFHSGSVERNRKPIEGMVKSVEKMLAVPNLLLKENS